ncbi:adenosylcobinamide amidohydrolase [Cohaesibacter intestini]|uniref:adenosylcobinamide amidohydrolase n=1 Tax=Cohaesibacter intestini TaxID=2211145 RepID=UPI001FE03727|nr:adenosylcobinamide amidohydrolase [Cohaesibacter intestini]
MTNPASPLASITLACPWLTIQFSRTMRVLSWAIDRPGLVEADRILWREVKNHDLPVDLDVRTWLQHEQDKNGFTNAVTMLTSRSITRYEIASAEVDEVSALCVATVGLSNAERIGARVDHQDKDWGTINIAVLLSEGLTKAAMLEASSIATQARTAAICDAHYAIPTGLATGTGTDCIAIAAPIGDTCFAGLHTAIGEAIGKSVYDAIAKAVADWIMENDPANKGTKAVS